MITLTLKGKLYSKSNSRKLVTNWKTKKPMFIKSGGALKTTEDYILQAKEQYKGEPLKGELWLYAKIYYKDRRPDLDDSLLCDILQAAGVIENDRMIFHKELHKDFDKDNPRVEVRLETMEELKSRPHPVDILRELSEEAGLDLDSKSFEEAKEGWEKESGGRFRPEWN